MLGTQLREVDQPHAPGTRWGWGPRSSGAGRDLSQVMVT
jgi:hypothetical protein